MAAIIETWFNQDLMKPVQVHYLDGNLFSHNGGGNRIGVHVYNNGVPATLTGSVTGYVVTSDGSTVPCTGTRSGSDASILIPAAAYQPGTVFITIFISSGDTVTTLASVATSVLVARTSNQVSPGSVVSDWTDTINAAMQDVVDASVENIALPYASLTYPVPLGAYTIHDNLLYRCTTAIPSSEAWTSSHWTRARLADDVQADFSDLKSAIDPYFKDLSTAVPNTNPGTVVVMLGIESGHVYSITNKTGYSMAAYTKTETNVIVETISTNIANNGNVKFTASQDAYQMTVYAKSDGSGYVTVNDLSKKVPVLEAKVTAIEATNLEQGEAISVFENNVYHPLTVTGTGLASVIADYTFEAGKKYTLKNNGSSTVTARTYNSDNQLVETIKDTFTAGSTITFTPTVNAPKFNAYGTDVNIYILFDRIRDDIADSAAETKAELDEAFDTFSDVYVNESFNHTGSGATYDFAFKANRRYIVSNLGPANTIAVRTYASGAVVESITEDCQKGGVYFFTPTKDAPQLRLYGNATVLRIISDKVNNAVDNGNLIMNPAPLNYFANASELTPITRTGGLSAMYAMWDALVTAYPDNITKSDLGLDESETYHVYSYTIKSYSDVITGRRINKNLKFLWICAIHGGEQESTIATYLFIKELLEKRFTDPYMYMIWSNCEFVIVPTANPWGYENNSRYNSNGVNLNRNFSYDWQLVDQSQDPYNYGGTEPMSEAETQILATLIDNNLDAFCLINHHGTDSLTASGGTIYYTASKFYSERFAQENICRAVDGIIKSQNSWLVTDVTANAKKNNCLTTWGATNTHGTLDDYASMVKNIHAFLLEVAYVAGNSYPNATQLDMENISVTVAGNVIGGYVLQNMQIKLNGEKPPAVT